MYSNHSLQMEITIFNCYFTLPCSAIYFSLDIVLTFLQKPAVMLVSMCV